MSEHYIIIGDGNRHLTDAERAAAEKAGGVTVNTYHDGCRCGYGCARACPAAKRHWISVVNRGDYENGKAERRIRAAVEGRD